MKMEVRKCANLWYVVKVLEDGSIEAIAGFKTKKIAIRAMEGYKEWMK